MYFRCFVELSDSNLIHVLQFHPPLLGLLTILWTDTLLNVFLAIAVDNLANAQELTKVCSTVLRVFMEWGIFK